MSGRIILIAVSLALAAVAGCVQETHPVNPTPVVTTVDQDFSHTTDTAGPVKTFDPDDILGGDPSAVRLDKIQGDLMLYLAEHDKQMPASLVEMKTAVGDASLILQTPAGQDYVYAAQGLWLPNQNDKCIVVYDPKMSADGKRWCLVRPTPRSSAAYSSMAVVEIPEPLFKSYRAPGK